MAIDEVPDFTQCTEVAALGCGGKVLFASDDFFAAAEGMLRDSDPVFIEDKYTDYGKWMDGWETRRKRLPGHDWCIIKLTGPTIIKGFLIDTAHFTGNYAPKISIQAASLPASADGLAPGRKPDAIGRAPSNRDFDKIARLKSNEWIEIVPTTELQPGYKETRYTYVHNTEHFDKYTHIRVNIYPDGGVARLRVYGDIELEPLTEPSTAIIDVLGLQFGGRCLQFSNAHYGHPKNLNKPGRGVNMGDGWETARRLDRPAIIELTDKNILNIPGSEWAIFRLAGKATIVSIDVDTNHFKGNAPEYVTIEGTLQCGDHSTNFDDCEWTVILDKVKLQPHKLHAIKKEVKSNGPFSSIRITMAPDGGISRVRVWGQLCFEKPEPQANTSGETNGNTNENTNENTNGNTDKNADGNCGLSTGTTTDKNADEDTDQTTNDNEKPDTQSTE